MKKTKHHNTFILFIRSLLFSIYSITSIVLYSFLCAISFLLSLKTRHMLIRVFLRAYIGALRFICCIDYRVEGLHHLPKKGSGIVFSKHQSTWETMFLPLIFQDAAFIAKRELLWIPFFGWGLAASDPIAINRSDKSSAMQQIIKKGKAALSTGRWVVFFPEGTRTAVGQVGHYRLGGARLAAATGAPVYPVAHNAGICWPRRQFLKIPGTITVVIGPAIETQGRAPDDIMSEAKTWIEAKMQLIA
ncbi:MAG TPA: lysophospholipid acyltransferase family protein [Gammaproteobacteria bacterium]|nr:lysophospholipid acyltransferase family protein [Gammaproteobacteria bacterium]